MHHENVNVLEIVDYQPKPYIKCLLLTNTSLSDIGGQIVKQSALKYLITSYVIHIYIVIWFGCCELPDNDRPIMGLCRGFLKDDPSWYNSRAPFQARTFS